MSNLTLPTLTLANLRELLSRTAYGTAKRIGYETTATLTPDDGPTQPAYVVIRHHGTTIAEVGDNFVYISNAGWDSATTRQRISRVLSDNGIPAAVVQRAHRQVLMLHTFTPIPDDVDADNPYRLTEKRTETDAAHPTDRSPLGAEFRSAMFHRDPRTPWMLTEYNGIETPAAAAEREQARA